MRLELCTNDRVGILSDVTCIFRENGMSVTRAEVSTRCDKATDVFYVIDTAGNPVDNETVEVVSQELDKQSCKYTPWIDDDGLCAPKLINDQRISLRRDRRTNRNLA